MSNTVRLLVALKKLADIASVICKSVLSQRINLLKIMSKFLVVFKIK